MSCTIYSTLTRYCTSAEASVLDDTITTEIYHSHQEINTSEWSKVVTSSHRFLCLDYLSSLEDAHDEGLELRYAVFRSGGEVIGAAAFQITHFTTSEDAYQNVFLRFLNRMASLLRGKHVHNILICGNAIATGEHGFSFMAGLNASQISHLIAGAMRTIARQEKDHGRKICAMVVKDFYPASAGVADHLQKAGFKKFQVDHNMVMPVLKEWISFNHYLESMNTKFRTKAKAALNKSKALNVVNESAESIHSLIPELTTLYENVHHKADFRLGKLNLQTLPLLLEHLPANFFVKTYHLEDRVVGFMSAMICGPMMEAHVIGIDYDVNRDYAVYQRMLYDYVELAIDRRCERIVFGRTAAEIKSTVGAYPVDLTCCFLHQQRISNALLSRILNYVKPSDYPQRQPYKAEVLQQIQSESLQKSLI
ncbi:MAG: GNAT family N-acetyltransferase [Flavobacteriales bacterium]|nr:GNAT family N-acetyltransferase [Flavobacteriales bacterium]